MDPVSWYLVACCGLCVLVLSCWVLYFFLPNLRNTFTRIITLPLLVKRTRHWDSMTRSESIMLLAFFLANLILVLFPFAQLDLRLVQQRFASLSIVNLIPLFVTSPTGLVAKVLNVHRSTHGHFHRWVGRVVVIEALLHTTIALVLKPRAGPLVTSGALCFGASVMILVVSVNANRAWLKFLFIPAHVALVLTLAGALLWHTKDIPRKRSLVLVAMSVAIWVMSATYRRIRLYWRPLIGKVAVKSGDANATKIEVVLDRPTRVPPGSYFNLFFQTRTGYSLIGYPAVAFWHTPDDLNPSHHLSTVAFLLSYRNSYASVIDSVREGDRIHLEGPFGQKHELSSQESVMLVAKGIGIAGVLPLALELAERRQHDDRIRLRKKELLEEENSLREEESRSRGDRRSRIAKQRQKVQIEREKLGRKPLFRDAIKSVDLYWSLEDNSQVEWLAPELRALKKMDPQNRFLLVWCGYPQHRTGAPPFRIKRPYWMCVEPSSEIASFDQLVVSKLSESRQQGRGKMIVYACGDGSFTNMVRGGVIKNKDSLAIDFVEVEYRPSSHHSRLAANTAMGSWYHRGRRTQPNAHGESDDISMQSLTARSSDGSRYSVASWSS